MRIIASIIILKGYILVRQCDMNRDVVQTVRINSFKIQSYANTVTCSILYSGQKQLRRCSKPNCIEWNLCVQFSLIMSLLCCTSFIWNDFYFVMHTMCNVLHCYTVASRRNGNPLSVCNYYMSASVNARSMVKIAVCFDDFSPQRQFNKISIVFNK